MKVRLVPGAMQRNLGQTVIVDNRPGAGGLVSEDATPVGAAVNGQDISRSDIVREAAQIPDEEASMTCVALGYPDDAF